MLISPTNGTIAVASSALATPSSVVAPTPPAELLPKTPLIGTEQSALDRHQFSDHPDKDSIDRALDLLNKFTDVVAQGVQFSLDEESGRTVVKVVDIETKEVLRQFPSKEALAIAHSLDRMQGLLIDDKA